MPRTGVSGKSSWASAPTSGLPTSAPNEKFGRAPVNGLLRWRQNIDTDQGAKADGRVTVGILGTEHHRVGLFAQLTWASERSNQTYFGVMTGESTATGLPVYSAGAGLRNSVLGVLGAYDLSRHWVAWWGAQWHRLLGDTRDGPYTQDTTNDYYTIGVTYRF